MCEAETPNAHERYTVHKRMIFSRETFSRHGSPGLFESTKHVVALIPCLVVQSCLGQYCSSTATDLQRGKRRARLIVPQVTNNGNLDLSTVTVEHSGVTHDCADRALLSPGESFHCTGYYSLSWLDVAAGVLDMGAT